MEAFVSLKDNHFIFEIPAKNLCVRYYVSPTLEKLLKIKYYEDGYLEIDCQFSFNPCLEEYFDVKATMEELGLDNIDILKEVNEVLIRQNS